MVTAGGALVAPATAAAGRPAPACTLDAGAGLVTCTYHAIRAEQVLEIPAGVDTVHVVAVGGAGAPGAGPEIASRGGAGGLGAMVTGDVPVAGMHTLYIEIGGNGVDGGWPNSGDSGQAGGDGGGSSDVRTVSATHPTSTSTRLLVAAGGGGGGGGIGGGAGGAGGAAGQPGSPGIPSPAGDVPGGGGAAATTTGGILPDPGGAGSAWIGGNGAAALGGGGGGGLFGGGGGGAGRGGSNAADSGGGGGGGSSLVPAGGTLAPAGPGRQPQIVVTYRSTTPPCTLTGPAAVLCGTNLPFTRSPR
ncbi:hypothetical protein G4X40_05770 [Rhodococcus sp. D2-41]|uniref:hypothetical protein n=1 Tax=Speluncibacter jeojiensis TaxID=2710754 RepID=UPI00240F1D09|nr:hypothetical protein [Rhodococcus sp. D2-41]MDG3009651.1 hypothetical protein [Rhodococcus sp. D2-41]